MTTLAEQKAELVSSIRDEYTQRMRRLSTLYEEPPKSFVDQEHRREVVAMIRRDGDAIILPLMYRLQELCAIEECDGVWFVSPIEPRHVEEAKALIRGGA